MKRYLIPLIMALLVFVNFNVKSEIPQVVGIAGCITINGEKIADGYPVTVENLNTSQFDNTTTLNGYFVSALTAKTGDIIRVTIIYDGKEYTNYTVVDINRTTQWCNISISLESSIMPVIKIKKVYYCNEGEYVVLDASECYDPDGEIISYQWTLYTIPPQTLLGVTVKKKFDDDCHIFGLLTVTDDGGHKNSSEFEIIVNNTNPVVSLQYHEYREFAGNKILFIADARDKGNDELKYRWDFDGDGKWDTEWLDTNRIEYTYTRGGNYTLTVQVMDDDGGYANDFAKVIIYGSTDYFKPIADFIIEGNLTINSTIYFNSTSYDRDGYIVNWTWDIDGVKLYGENVEYVFDFPGEKHITLRVVDNEGLFNITSKTIYIGAEEENNNNQNNSGGEVKKYKLKIYSDKPTKLSVFKDGYEIYHGEGNYFELEVERGTYKIVYLMDGETHTKTININGDKELRLGLEGGGLPAFTAPIIILAIIVYTIWRRYNEKVN